MKLFRRIRDFFGPKPGMEGIPPSARPMWDDPAAHAVDVSRRYAMELDYLTAQRMTELGIPIGKIGTPEPGNDHATFIPHEQTGGGNDATGGLTLDSGVLNPDLLGTLPENEEWAKARLCDRMDAAIAHEHEEARRGGSHVEALRYAPETELPIREGGLHLLRAIRPKERNQ